MTKVDSSRQILFILLYIIHFLSSITRLFEFGPHSKTDKKEVQMFIYNYKLVLNRKKSTY